MASSTGHPAPVSKDIYWRRRAFVLAGLMLVLALITYACRPSGDDGEPTGSQAALEEPGASPSIAEDEPSEPETEEEAEDPSASPSPSPSEGGEAEGGEDAGGGSGEAESEDGGEVAAPERPEDPCRPQDVVVTFDFAEDDREVYGGGASPGFKVTVVNVAEQTCTAGVGPEAIELRIHSGDDRVYSSADCVEGKAEEERQLSQGRPHEYTLDWARERSFTDCRESSAKAQPGWYKANLHGEHVGNVDQLVFQLKA
ncbi:hypothetical protein H4W79_004517 [Nocardiopsis terrae]|uniref:DUF4232 domain-containing protein n=1 Tax=Nocardiopsis terrae TaxID=372655 RepID=A0ABR9HMX2_9ACTN|nr:hypothetical protein [Nocardiopsis terrae]MBE1460303.1 hypothetical protein [Nocardiopsis terrae]